MLSRYFRRSSQRIEGALGEDSDAALALLIVGSMARSCRASFARKAALGEQLIDKSSLTVVDVGDDREVAEALGHELQAF